MQKDIKKDIKFDNKKLPLRDGEYYYTFPLSIFSKKNIKITEKREDIKKRLQDRNIYYNIFDKETRNTLIERVFYLKKLINFIVDFIKKEEPSRKILSIYSYGSYFYRNNNFIPEDIDIGVVLEGNIFKYILDKVFIPYSIHKKINLPTKKIRFFFYGKDNMSFGSPINDTVIAGVVHKETIKRELAISYWRNIVIWGKDFKYLENNKKNISVVIARMMNGCYERFRLYGKNNKEDKKTTLRKISVRLIEVNVFMKFFDPELSVKWNVLSRMYQQINNGGVSFEKIKRFYKVTLSRYYTFQQKINRIFN